MSAMTVYIMNIKGVEVEEFAGGVEIRMVGGGTWARQDRRDAVADRLARMGCEVKLRLTNDAVGVLVVRGAAVSEIAA